LLEHRRVLIIDDNRAIHEDFRKILMRPDSGRSQLQALAAELFGEAVKARRFISFELDSAFQGKDGSALVEKALAAARPYALAFVDMRMPPGLDGLETIAELWAIQPDLQVVLCTAHSDYSLDEIQEKVQVADRLVILKKPFDSVEVLQLAQALTEKWRLGKLAEAHAANLATLVEERTAELQEANRFLQEQARLIDLVPDAISVRGLDDRLQFWSVGAEQLYGWKAEEILGKSLPEILFPCRSDYFEAKEALLARGEWHGELTQRTKADVEITVSSRWTLVRDAAGQPKSILVINTDITERKKLQHQFLRAQRMESIGTLASGVAHDLNNILAPILMCAPMLRDEMRPEQKESLVSVIESSAARGAQIVRQVLAFGRGLEGERQPIDLRQLIQEIVQIASETFPKNIRISCDVDPALGKIIGDQTQWHQVLLNLSVNARDAMPAGGELCFRASNLEIDAAYVSMQPTLSPGSHVVLEVSDTGAGIPPELTERIFDPFFTTKAIGKGTGLGLSTVAGIVKSHGGIIDLKSVPGRGTTFHLLVPATSGAFVSLAAGNEPAVRPQGHGELVLLVDDEESIRQVGQHVLEKHGYRAMLAADGPEALALYAQHRENIAVVLTDIMMPIMDGTVLIRALRKMEIRVPVLASTGQGERARLDELAALHVSGILHKPYAAHQLLGLLEQVLHPGEEVAAGLN
jgi:PAS domain S-box-containing protein